MMTGSDRQLVQFLQKENIKLDKKVKAGQQQMAQLEGYVDLMAELYWAVQKIESVADPIADLARLHARCTATIEAEDGSISLLDRQKNELVFLIVHGAVRDGLTGYRISATEGVAGWALESAETVVIDNAHQDWRFSMQVDQEFAFTTRSMLCVPIPGEPHPLGVIQLLNKRHNHPFNEIDVTVAKVLGDIAARVLAHLSPVGLQGSGTASLG
jgi:GAF domain-containing protein